MEELFTLGCIKCPKGPLYGGEDACPDALKAQAEFCNLYSHSSVNNKCVPLEDYVSDDGEYIIPVSWSVYSTITVEADNLAQAIAVASSKLDELPLSDDSEYIDGSYEIAIKTAEDALVAQDYVNIGNVHIAKDGKISK